MFEFYRSDDGNIAINDSFINYSVASYVDLVDRLPNSSDYTFGPSTLVFRRVLSTSGGTLRRFLFCERKVSPILPSAGSVGFVVYSQSGVPVFSSEEKYVKFVEAKTHTFPTDLWTNGTYATGNIPNPKDGGYVYVLQNTASVVLTLQGNFSTGAIRHSCSLYTEPTPSTYQLSKFVTSWGGQIPLGCSGIRLAGTGGMAVHFAEFNI